MKTTMLPPGSNGKVRILLCGYGHLGLALLDGLLGCLADCELLGVFRWSSRPGSGHFWEPVEGEFQRRIAQQNLTDIRCPGMNAYEFTAILQKLQPDVVLVGSWGEILRPHLLDEPKPLIINCHPSKLPTHRGANPYSSVIRQGETETGVTFHRMASSIDAGDIVLQWTVPLSPYEDGASVRNKCAETAKEMMPALVSALKAHFIHNVPLPLTPQNHDSHSYYPQLKPEDGLLDWQENVETVYRQIRSLFPWIACYSRLHGQRPVLFYDPRFVHGDRHGQEPGTILTFKRGILQIAAASDELVLEVSAYQFARMASPNSNTYWPMWLSPFLAPFLLRPGHRFTSGLN